MFCRRIAPSNSEHFLVRSNSQQTDCALTKI
jgi:hypothetical protein